MPINLRIEADVVDIRQDAPTPSDHFLIDSNVWYWLTYTKASQGENRPHRYQAETYPTYLNSALKNKSKLYRCDLSLAELAYLIEKTEFDIFCRSTSNRSLSKKMFRHNHPNERSTVTAEINTAWGQVKKFALAVEAKIDESFSDGALGRCCTSPVDVYDSFMVEALKDTDIINVITDDGDYATIPGISIFTANKNVIRAARQQSKLVTR